MAADLFDFVAERLEHHTVFDRLEARGTLRIALKVAGLDPSTFTAGQLCVVFEKVMPAQLQKRGVKETKEVCAAVLADVGSAGGAAENARASNPDEIFRRLAEG